MKATDLMVWDWADLSEGLNESIPCIVVELHTDELLVIQPNDKACDVVGYDMIRPIPLTAEMLEKNGIKFQFGNPWYQYHEGRIQIVCNDVRICVDYVHELQHLLRICGLNDLADNFKV